MAEDQEPPRITVAPALPPKPPPSKAPSSPAKLRRELSIFMFGLGFLLAIGAFLTLSYLNVPSPLWGFKRNLALGVPLAIIALLHLASGGWLAARQSVAAGLLGVFGSVCLAGLYVAMMVTVTGTLSISLITVLLVFLPALVAIRLAAFARAIRQVALATPKLDSQNAV